MPVVKFPYGKDFLSLDIPESRFAGVMESHMHEYKPAGTPASLAKADPSLAVYETAATAQMAASCIVTAILCPIFVNFLHRCEVKRQAKVAAKKAGKA